MRAERVFERLEHSCLQIKEKAKTADASAVAAMKSSDLAQIKVSSKQVSMLMQEIAEAK